MPQRLMLNHFVMLQDNEQDHVSWKFGGCGHPGVTGGGSVSAAYPVFTWLPQLVMGNAPSNTDLCSWHLYDSMGGTTSMLRPGAHMA